MTTKLKGKASLVEHLIPNFAVGCRRPTPGNGYLEALTDPKVTVITEEISEIVPKGIKLANGEVVEVDTFICATGFDISFAPRFPLIGRNGINLAEQWKTRPEAYLSMSAANMPNHFSMCIFCLISRPGICSILIPNISVPWAQLSCWSRFPTSVHRTDDQIHPSYIAQMPNAGYQSCCPSRTSYFGLHGAH
jgi:hypothetical protein